MSATSFAGGLRLGIVLFAIVMLGGAIFGGFAVQLAFIGWLFVGYRVFPNNHQIAGGIGLVLLIAGLWIGGQAQIRNGTYQYDRELRCNNSVNC